MRCQLACLREHIAEWLQQRARTGLQVALQMKSNVELQRASEMKKASTALCLCTNYWCQLQAWIRSSRTFIHICLIFVT